MLLIAQRAWLRRVSVPPQLGGPTPVAVSIEPDVSSASTTYGFSGSPLAFVIGAIVMIASVANASHAEDFPMVATYWVGQSRKWNLGDRPT